MKPQKVIILAAGRGIRMGDLTENCPKPMIPIAAKPKLAYTLHLLPKSIVEVIFIIGYRGNVIKNYFGSSYGGRTITYIEQKELNGTGGAIVLAKEYIKNERFLVLMGDDLYCKKDLEQLMSYECGLLAFVSHEAQQYGLVEKDENGVLCAIVEKPHGRQQGLVNTAAYILTPEYFTYDPVRISATEFGLPQTLAAMHESYPTHVFETDCWQPVGKPEDITKAELWLKKHSN